MTLPFRYFLTTAAILTGVATSYSVLATEEIYDRLDGKGPSKKRVDVIEWEGNLEIHTYPKGSLKGLSAKLDDRTEGKKVMVIGYRFSEKGRPLVRRAILGIPFDKNVKGFVDTSDKDCDKMAISNQNLGAPWKPYKLDPAPLQWYPDGDERNNEEAPHPYLGEMKRDIPSRAPASVPTEQAPAPRGPNNDGSMNHFNW